MMKKSLDWRKGLGVQAFMQGPDMLDAPEGACMRIAQRQADSQSI